MGREELEKRLLELEAEKRELVEADKRLEEEVALRRLLIDTSLDGIVVIDQHGKVVESNRRFADMLGYSLDEVHELHVWDWDLRFTKEELLQFMSDPASISYHFETRHRRKDGAIIDVEISNNGVVHHRQARIFCICRDITERKRAAREKEELIEKLQKTLAEVKTLRGILPLCSYCKKVRDYKGYWEAVDVYIRRYSVADVSHGICPECVKEHFPEFDS